MPKSEPKTPASLPGHAPASTSAAQCPKACTITSETAATIPSNRTRTRIGVGERVNLTVAPGPAEWTIQSGGGKLSETNGATVTYTAPERAATVKIAAKGAGGCECSIEFQVVEPSGVLMQRDTSKGKDHTHGTASTGMQTNIWITPADVSFEAIEIHEQEVDAVGTGCFAQYFQTHHVGHHPNPGWTGISAVEANGSKVNTQDHVAFSGSACAGTISWSIPWEFRVNSGGSKVFVVLDQVGTFTASGAVTATKASATVSSARNDPTETP